MNTKSKNKSDKAPQVGVLGLKTPATAFGLPAAIDLFGHQNITDFDFVLMSLSALYADYAKILAMEGVFGYADQKTHDVKLPHITERLNKVRALVDAGSPLIILMDHFKVEHIKLVGHGGHVNNHTPFELSRLMLPGTRPHQGVGVDFCYQGATSDEEMFKDCSIHYHWELVSTDLQTIFKSHSKLDNDRKIVGGLFIDQYSGGIIAFVPPPQLANATSARSYIVELIRFCWRLQNERRSPRPDWVNSLWMPCEASYARKASIKHAQAKAKVRSADRIQKALAQFDWQRDLIVGTDKALEQAVIRSLNYIGIPAVAGPPGRADFVALMDGHLLIGEIKGYEGAAKEACVGQCRKWLADASAVFLQEPDEWDEVSKSYVTAFHKLPVEFSRLREFPIKGLIICNTYRNIHVSDRPSLETRLGEHFSLALQGMLSKEKMAALTSLQLLGCMHDHRNSLTNTKSWAEKILRNSAVFVGHSDHRVYLSMT